LSLALSLTGGPGWVDRTNRSYLLFAVLYWILLLVVLGRSAAVGPGPTRRVLLSAGLAPWSTTWLRGTHRPARANPLRGTNVTAISRMSGPAATRSSPAPKKPRTASGRYVLATPGSWSRQTTPPSDRWRSSPPRFRPNVAVMTDPTGSNSCGHNVLVW